MGLWWPMVEKGVKRFGIYHFLNIYWMSCFVYPKGPYIKYVRGGAGGFLWGSWNILGIYWWAMKYLLKILMGHKIFSYVLFPYVLKGLEHKISQLAMKKIWERQNMLNKSHPLIHLADIKKIVAKIQKNIWCILILMLEALSLPIDTRNNFVTNFLQ